MFRSKCGILIKRVCCGRNLFISPFLAGCTIHFVAFRTGYFRPVQLCRILSSAAILYRPDLADACPGLVCECLNAKIACLMDGPGVCEVNPYSVFVYKTLIIINVCTRCEMRICSRSLNINSRIRPSKLYDNGIISPLRKR